MTGTELKEIRERAGLLQPEFAERLGVHAVTLSRFERNRKPIPLTVELAVFELERRLQSESAKSFKKAAIFGSAAGVTKVRGSVKAGNAFEKGKK